MIDLCKILMTDAQNGGKMTKLSFESYWKESQQFFQSPTNRPNIIITIDRLSAECRMKNLLPLTALQIDEYYLAGHHRHSARSWGRSWGQVFE